MNRRQIPYLVIALTIATALVVLLESSPLLRIPVMLESARGRWFECRCVQVGIHEAPQPNPSASGSRCSGSSGAGQ